MNAFTIQANAITTSVEAESTSGAILAYVRQAGYDAVSDAAAVCGQSEDAFVADIVVKD